MANCVLSVLNKENDDDDDIEDLEKVQNTATRLLPELEGFKYCYRLKACISSYTTL